MEQENQTVQPEEPQSEALAVVTDEQPSHSLPPSPSLSSSPPEATTRKPSRRSGKAGAQLQDVPAADSDIEQLKEQLSQLRQELESVRRERELVEAAAETGVPVTLASRLVDPTRPEPAGEQLKRWLSEYPFLRPQSAPALPVANPSRPLALSKDALKEMDEEEINRNWEIVQKILSGSKV